MGKGSNTREQLMDATERIIRDQGIMAVTTKDIAREAGFAEATLYRHFQDKSDLLLAVMNERISGHFLQVIRELPSRAGKGDVAATLEELARVEITHFARVMPLNVALSSDPNLQARHNAQLRELGGGPEASLRSVMAYIEAEQRLGRIRKDANPAAVATLFNGTCFNYARMRHVAGEDATALSEAEFPHEIVRTLLEGLTPPSGA